MKRNLLYSGLQMKCGSREIISLAGESLREGGALSQLICNALRLGFDNMHKRNARKRNTGSVRKRISR
ncbi:hypothetical protein Desaf_1452 [Desulfocurvibacter africanus subsp. africanus str. Walvis Bay]|uniref:Uncharacterized protein n=1 Tax=Desulfocurvibacter africanus subsp. africanus str. Walvis Bay TaxID=690850 RepID=F3Z087_DESAF|nr:hypothetical protein Desaf_1452 [Desulfocurvibacter africanus subsp. africanus str. Walvis Bay]